MTGNEVRRKFIEYFKSHQHQVVRSASLVPHDDPTLLFTNAGMVQFKRTFIGEEKRDYNTAVTSQKCVRAGGKHNDLENVGYTARHHTFFEMLGNFSFGDYFKEKATAFAWDLLVNGYGLPVDKLWVSIFQDDDEAFDIWHKKVGVAADRIVRLGEKDNFWAMGDTGPCGPCSEIHIDRGEAFGCDRPDCRVGCDCDRYLEIWNLVFMQFNRAADGTMTPLPKPSIDTGMGLERICAVLQNAPTNYETDLFVPIMEKVETLTGCRMGSEAKADVAMKVIADHSRATAFLIGDGVLPSNEGRGYVLRRIMRRAIRYGRNVGLTKPFLDQTAEVVFDIMQEAYPELKTARDFIVNVIRNEEIRFSETLDNGLRLLGEHLAAMQQNNETVVPGELIFKLYDTFGFPVDIVRDVVRDEQLSLDMDGFEQAMEQQRQRSRSVATFTALGDAYKKLSAQGIKADFKGYDQLETQGRIMVLVQDGQEINLAEAGSEIEVITDETPFYGESGGQVGDVGRISAGESVMQVTGTRKDPTGLIIHVGKVAAGQLKKGDAVTLTVDAEKRRATALNHTATHILHAVLRKVLGNHVKQAGSLVSPDRLRFDFSHFSAIDGQTLDRIETQVNQWIRENIKVNADEMDAEEAFRTGAMALFEEKYGDRVRVISMADFSKEFCGGTHTRRTGDIGLFKIVTETSIAAGVRRIEALTGAPALAMVQNQLDLLHQSAGALREKPETLPSRIEKLIGSQKALEREVDQLKSQLAMAATGEAEADPYKTINGVKVLSKKVAIDKPAALRELADKFRDRIQSGIVVLGAVAGPKAQLIVVVTKDLIPRFHAGNIVKALAAEVGGSGGGRPDMAQAGGPQPEKLDQALEKIYEIIV